MIRTASGLLGLPQSQLYISICLSIYSGYTLHSTPNVIIKYKKWRKLPTHSIHVCHLIWSWWAYTRFKKVPTSLWISPPDPLKICLFTINKTKIVSYFLKANTKKSQRENKYTYYDLKTKKKKIIISGLLRNVSHHFSYNPYIYKHKS